MMRALRQEEAAVPCRVCLQASGSRCVAVRTGAVAQFPHSARLDDAAGRPEKAAAAARMSRQGGRRKLAAS